MTTGHLEEFVRLICRGLGETLWRSRAALALLLLAATTAATLRLGHSTVQLTATGKVAANPFLLGSSLPGSNSRNQGVHVAYGRLPLIFERNQGQSDSQVKFLARGAGYGLFLTADEAVLALRASTLHSKSSGNGPSVLRMQMPGANSSGVVSGERQLPGHSNYFTGNDPSRWHRDIPQFSRVRYAKVYPGVDLVYYGNGGRLEYDFELAPGADPRQIQLRFVGSDRLTLQNDGDLLLHLRGGDVQLHAPQVYQEIAGQRQPVPARFIRRGRREVGFELGAYDPSRALVIDPVLSYSSYLGGTGDEGCSVITGQPTSGCPAIAVDSAANIYLAGTTTSTDFPTTPGAFRPTPPPGASVSVFVTKLDSTGSTILFSTYLGGDKINTSAGVGVDSGLNVAVAGSTTSDNFPVTPNAFQTVPASAGQHVFVTELDPTGSTLLYSTYLSGTNITNTATDAASGLAVDFRNKLYVVGTTTSTNVPTGTTSFPATLGAFQTCSTLDQPPAAQQCGTNRFFLSKIDPLQSGFLSLAYSTYFAGGNPLSGVTSGGGVAVDTAANVYITGGTNYQRTGTPADFPIVNAYQSCLNTPPPIGGTTQNCTNTSANTDAFVAKFNLSAPSGAQLLYSTYLGGSADDVGNGIAVDSGFNAYVTGSTTSTDFILPVGAPFQSQPGGGIDAFLGKLGNPCTGSTCTSPAVPLTYFSYLGGSKTDVGMAIAVDSAQSSIGGARITGYTNSIDFPKNSSVNIPIQACLDIPPPSTTCNPNVSATDAFVSRIDTTANSATAPGHYGTYLGGGDNDYGTAIATDVQGNSYVAGETASGDFPTKNPLDGTPQGKTDAFISKLAPFSNLLFQPNPTALPSPVGVGTPVSFEFGILNSGDLVQTVTVTDFLPQTGATFNSASASPGACTNTVVNFTVQCVVGPLNAGQTATVTVSLSPTAPNPPSTRGFPITDSALIDGICPVSSVCSATATVNDFNLAVSPASPPPVVAGGFASVSATVTPTGNFPESVTLGCGSGLPTGVACSFNPNNSIQTLSGGPQSRPLTISTQARVTTPASLWRSRRIFYAACFPVLGFALLGILITEKGSRRRGLLALLLAGCFSSVLFQAACGSSSTTSTTTGTPAGTYTITVTATSGTAPTQAVRTQDITLTVQ